MNCSEAVSSISGGNSDSRLHLLMQGEWEGVVGGMGGCFWVGKGSGKKEEHAGREWDQWGVHVAISFSSPFQLLLVLLRSAPGK